MTKAVVLQRVFRQKNGDFVHALNELRMGRLSATSSAMLSQGGGKSRTAAAGEQRAEPVRLFAHNSGADNLNRQRLHALTTDKLTWEVGRGYY